MREHFSTRFGLAFRSVAACCWVYQWGCPGPTGSHLLDCPLPKECGGPRWGVVAKPLSFQSQSSRLLFCLSSRAQTARSCPQPAGLQQNNDHCTSVRINLSQNYHTADLVCSEEIWRLQDLTQLFQTPQISPLMGRIQDSQEWSTRANGSLKVTLTTICVLDSTKVSSASVTCSLLLVRLKFVQHSWFAFYTGMYRFTALLCSIVVQHRFTAGRNNLLFSETVTSTTNLL